MCERSDLLIEALEDTYGAKMRGAPLAKSKERAFLRNKGEFRY